MKSGTTIALGALGLLVTVGFLGVRAGEAQGNQGQGEVQIGFDLAPVPLDLTGRSPGLVGLGSYIVNAQGGCNDCHTNPPYADGGNPFLGQPEQINAAGYLAGGVQFGPFVSRNLTPHPTTGLPANLTFDQFREVMREGTDFKNLHPQISPLLQVMPWPVYGHMTDRDLRAVYEFLSSIPTVQ